MNHPKHFFLPLLHLFSMTTNLIRYSVDFRTLGNDVSNTLYYRLGNFTKKKTLFILQSFKIHNRDERLVVNNINNHIKAKKCP